jgi:hypothetical protein
MRRLIVLGASNLTRGFRIAVDTARASGDEPLEVFAALGHGRSYGQRSRVLIRTLPGILESGIWRALATREAAPSTALVTDIGNDVLYGVKPALVLEWVETCLMRLRDLGARLVVTDLPVFNTRALSETAFALFCALLVPGCRLTLAEVARRARIVNEGVVALAGRYGATLVRLRPEWYGRDPIHIVPRHWAAAWQEIAGAGEGSATVPDIGRSPLTWLRLYLASPERRWLMGIEQRRGQPALRLRDGTTVWIY